MHPDNPYHGSPPDWAALALRHPPLAAHLRSSGRGGPPGIDFTSWEATKELTAALLAADYGVAWTLPAGQLVPPVPNRVNYLAWIADLLALSSPAGAGA